MITQHIRVSKTARYFLSRELTPGITTLWFCLHGYAQLAAEFYNSVSVLDDDASCVVVPEGLSRFYSKGGSGPVVASWMTREDRDYEINDYCDYLDQLLLGLKAKLGGEVTVNILGFSQGAATASRWFERINVPVTNLILWGAVFPPDMKQASFKGGRTRTWLFAGTNDRYLELSTVAKYEDRVDRIVSYEGDHAVDPEVLAAYFKMKLTS